MPAGRPSKYTKALGEEICERLIAGQLGIEIAELEHMPDWGTIWRWQEANPDFRDAYTQARLIQIERFSDMIVQRGLNEERDQPLANGKGGYTAHNTPVLRDRLAGDNLKWVAERLYEKKYGNKVKQELTGANGADLIPQITVTIKK